MRNLILILFCSMSFFSCKEKKTKETGELNKSTHSFADPEKIRTLSLNWDAGIDFEKKQVNATATWTFQNKNKVKEICFDTYDLDIKKVWVGKKEVAYRMGDFIEDYGRPLIIPIGDKDTVLSIDYSTGPKATALQWLDAAQTAGKKMPYLFTQCESIHARSLLPCQDLPSNRITYIAKVKVPQGMMALMSAKNPTEKTKDGIYSFEMEIPVPTYLIALAAGDIEYRSIDARTGVYTEPSMLNAAATELSDIPRMMQAAEELGGTYRWGRYDVLIAPPSFPIGGMENPRLTFATPTILAGDKSLVALIAHEMAHSWSGNLVTNASWEDLWLNEGFTTYFERRIMEKISDTSYTEMLWELGYQDMLSDLDNLGKDHPDTRLKVELDGRNPGDAFTNIPYEKGAVFLRMLELNVGREKFDRFLNAYFSTHAFTPTTTEKCLAFMDQHLFNGDTMARNGLLVREWIYQPGLPINSPRKASSRFALVDSQRIAFEKEGNIEHLKTSTWSTHEWLHFLRKLPHPLDQEKMKALDAAFRLTGSRNSEIADEWYKLAIHSGYMPAYNEMEKFLIKVGRKKFLEPLYMELMKTPDGKKMAALILEKARHGYHPLTAAKIEEIINEK